MASGRSVPNSEGSGQVALSSEAHLRWHGVLHAINSRAKIIRVQTINHRAFHYSVRVQYSESIRIDYITVVDYRAANGRTVAGEALPLLPVEDRAAEGAFLRDEEVLHLERVLPAGGGGCDQLVRLVEAGRRRRRRRRREHRLAERRQRRRVALALAAHTLRDREPRALPAAAAASRFGTEAGTGLYSCANAVARVRRNSRLSGHAQTGH